LQRLPRAMTDTRNDTASVVDRIHPVAAGGAVIAAHFLGRMAVFVLGEEAMVLAPPRGEPKSVAVHGGAILATAVGDAVVISGGDDGKVVETDVSGTSRTIATDPKHRWIDHVAIGPDGAVAWSAGKTAFVRPHPTLPRERGREEGERSFEAPSTVGGLAFLPKGFRLAMAHYNGATLWFPNAPKADPEKLEWKGSHLGVTVSPDGRFLVTTMQEPMLHGWRLVDRQHMRMSGYAARVTSVGWTVGGRWLATSGSTQIILWPFQTKDGPMGKQPKLLAPSEHRVAVVACHPKQDIVAAGYADGIVLLVRVEDGAEILAKRPGDAPVTALAWSADGTLLAFGTESGEAGILDLA
jgi:WD40 repeat protein